MRPYLTTDRGLTPDAPTRQRKSAGGVVLENTPSTGGGLGTPVCVNYAEKAVLRVLRACKPRLIFCHKSAFFTSRKNFSEIFPRYPEKWQETAVFGASGQKKSRPKAGERKQTLFLSTLADEANHMTVSYSIQLVQIMDNIKRFSQLTGPPSV